ncbi:nitrite/sulfite reductase [Terriglobus saanensis]|uniref:Nitrite and sulphite reductase 4Fe-4S region n=1 Tax=Terriglobus saanensis (strain ATCC BAA-1853 / DSM 23119 / SP1PR4) TaxID=401053 RepID=E8V3C6_TERSS|nr:nitrite/sulfite reductase [Terriglobus saanensis]ADV82483.1 nitrite and sulphite reductase 4Fe-4S region [Terriglobus saanensis SP1PR4]
MAEQVADAVVAKKETKAQKSERLKLEKNPWQAWEEVRQFAREGREAVVPDWANLYFKWWGIYTQGDGAGATGGVGGEGLVTEYFMMRVGIPNGILTSEQTRVIAQIAKDHGQNLADVTTRQNIQFHWLTIESLPLVVDALEKVGLSPKGACGDVVRNVTGCPLAGHDAAELFDASPIAKKVAATLTANNDFVNLPRKFKICITGCPIWCSYPEINDIALTGVANAAGELGFAVRVGGGLSKDPHIAVKLDAFIRQEQAEEVCIKIVEIFREQTVLRESRTTARLKFLFLKHGWTAESFLAELETRMGFKFDPAPAEHVPGDQYRDHTGVHPQKEKGLNYVGLTVLRGRMTGDQLYALADLADKYGAGDLRCTIQQNIILMGVPSEKVHDLIAEISKLELHVEGSSFWRGTVACTGTEFCKLAITETKGFARWIVDEMEERMPEFTEQLRINVTGCPNNCGQSWISDIGLEGKKIKQDGKLVDAYYFLLGGAVGDHAGIARPVGYRVPATEVPVAIERLLTTYMKQRVSDESLRGYFARYSNEELRGQLAGEIVAPVERDLPAGRVPGNVG